MIISKFIGVGEENCSLEVMGNKEGPWCCVSNRGVNVSILEQKSFRFRFSSRFQAGRSNSKALSRVFPFHNFSCVSSVVSVLSWLYRG